MPGSILLVFLCTGPIQAQVPHATIEERVTNPRNAIPPGTTGTVVPGEINVACFTSTSKGGLWQIQSLLSARSQYMVAVNGLSTAQRLDCTLRTANVKQFDMQLSIGSASKEAIATGETPLIDTTAATSDMVVTRSELDNLPFNTFALERLGG